MKYLHTMVRVADLDKSLDFYCNKLGLNELRRHEVEAGRFTLVFLAAPGDDDAQVELTHNWDPEDYDEGRNFGHLAYAVGRYLSILSKVNRRRRCDQQAATRRPHGICAITRQYFHRIAADGGCAGICGAVEFHGEHRALVETCKPG